MSLGRPGLYVLIREPELRSIRLTGPDRIRMEDLGNLFGCEGWGITSGEEGGVVVEVIGVATDSQRMEHLMDEGVAAEIKIVV